MNAHADTGTAFETNGDGSGHARYRQIGWVTWVGVAANLALAAVKVVFPWSTWPMVPTLTCGLVRANFALAIETLSFELIGIVI